MSAIETLAEGKPAVHPGFLGERAQELGNAVSRNLPMFYKRAFRFLGNRQDAEDAVQDALLSACKHLGQFRGQAQLSTWLTAIVTNAARMQLRRHRRGSYLSLEEPKGEDGLTFSEKLPDSKPGPEEVCSASEVRERVVNGISQLSPTLRRAFQLRDIDGLTTKEAAFVFGRPSRDLKSAARKGTRQACGNYGVSLAGTALQRVPLPEAMPTKDGSEGCDEDQRCRSSALASQPEKVAK